MDANTVHMSEMQKQHGFFKENKSLQDKGKTLWIKIKKKSSFAKEEKKKSSQVLIFSIKHSPDSLWFFQDDVSRQGIYNMTICQWALTV